VRKTVSNIAAGACCLATFLEPGLGYAAPAGPIDYGAQPTWEDFKAIGEHDLRSRLIDPESARIEWPYLAVKGSLKPFLGRTVFGYWACGLVNARNRMGGYTGATFFLIMEKDGVVSSLDIGQVNGMDTASITCADAQKKGTLPPAPAIASAPNPAPVSQSKRPKFGFSFMAVPQGAYIAAVESNSLAEKAGLKIGDVISAINGIPLAGIDQGTVQTMLGALQTAKLSLVGSREILIEAK
jgi:membrane-associated protease RseP (regulator of RpoE activity)